MDARMMSELKAMAEETRRLKRLYAEMSMQNDLLKEALGKKRQGRLNAKRWPETLFKDIGSASGQHRVSIGSASR